MSSFIDPRKKWITGRGGAPHVAETIAAPKFPHVEGLAKQLPGTDQNLSA